jgi:hypothetical protein
MEPWESWILKQGLGSNAPAKFGFMLNLGPVYFFLFFDPVYLVRIFRSKIGDLVCFRG